jgi:CheY-like chemotaxis protein/nitrogen-specific signal transduction histidine kinase
MAADFIERSQAEDERSALLESERAARSEAERASRMKEEFLATVSHELRTPLTAIVAWSDILRDDPGDAVALSRGIDVIGKASLVQMQMIEDLLDMSRIVSGKVRLDMRRMEIAPAIQAAIETVRPAAAAKGVAIPVRFDRWGFPVRGDPDRLQQVFGNLLGNAVKFTPSGGRVVVALRQGGSRVEVSVIDTGDGIAADFLPFVFDRFRQADGSGARKHGGLGLGLAIVRQLVELHGGAVAVTSPGAGRGSKFTVSLPLAEAGAGPEPRGAATRVVAAGAVAPASDGRIDLAGVRVLAVDDEPYAREIIQRVLEACHATVTTAATAAEALRRLVAERPDLLISDISMPGGDGYALIKQVRALAPERGGNTPALALTAFARAEDRKKAALAGFHLHVAKPVRPAELITKVASLVGRAELPA